MAGADPRRASSAGRTWLAADLGPAAAAAQARGGTASRAPWMSAVRRPGTRRRSTRTTSSATPRTSTGATPTSPREYLRVRRRRGLGGRDARGLARLLVGGDLRRVGRRLADAAAAVRRAPSTRDLAVALVNPGEERALSRGRLRPDAAHDPLHRQAARRTTRRSCRTTAERGASRSATWTSSDAQADLRHAEARSGRSALAATVPMVRALAARVDELVVLCDSAVAGAVPPNARVHAFGAADAGAARRAVRGRARARAEAAAARRRRAHGARSTRCSPRRSSGRCGIPLVLWYTHWKGHAVAARPPRRCRTAVVSVDRALVPASVAEGARHRARHRPRRVPVQRPARRRRTAARARARPLLAGEGARDDPARRVALAGGVRLEAHGSTGEAAEYDAHRRDARAARGGARRSTRSSAGPCRRAEVPGAVRAQRTCSSTTCAPARPTRSSTRRRRRCLPVLASNPVFDDLLPAGLQLRPRRSREPRRAPAVRSTGAGRPELRELVAEHHSVEHWADGVLGYRARAREARNVGPPPPEGRRHLRLGGAPARRCCRSCASAAGTSGC